MQKRDIKQPNGDAWFGYLKKYKNDNSLATNYLREKNGGWERAGF